MRKRARLTGVLAVMLTASVFARQDPFSNLKESTASGASELKGLVSLDVGGKPQNKRFVLRLPAAPAKWNGALVIGAHGGGGGDDYDRSGKVIATDETALDDVIGRYAIAHGFAYASVDRDGAPGGRDGFHLTKQFTDIAAREIAKRAGRAPARTYLVGLSAGGAITRVAAEDASKPYAGTLIIAGGGADTPTRLARQKRMAELWPDIDPRTHPDLPGTDPKIRAYADAIGTPVEARRLWIYTGAGAVAGANRATPQSENSSAVVYVPTIEVVGTWDDLMINDIRAYRARVRPQDLHRLYQVEGVWHMSGDDDGVWSFQYIAESRMKLGKDVADAMGEGPSYLPTVREAFDDLVRWVEHNTPPPASQTVKPGQPLQK